MPVHGRISTAPGLVVRTPRADPVQGPLLVQTCDQMNLPSERLRFVGVDALPTKLIMRMVRKGLLNRPVFAVAVGDNGCYSIPSRTLQTL